MHIFVAEYTDSGIKMVTIAHGTEAITWETRPYIRASRIDGANQKASPEHDLIFREINAFFASLPGERQEKIWRCYLAVNELFEAGYDPIAIQGRWQEVIEALYAQIPYDELREWASVNGVINLPMNLKTAYDEKDPIELTYLKQDYFELAVLAIACRPMVPIWGQYIPRLKNDVDNTFKEFVAVNLLYKTYLPVCQPYERLRRYVEASISAKSKPGNVHSALLKGLSSITLPDWLLACCLVRRTSVVPISGEVNGPNIITDVYQYVRNTLMSSSSRRFAGPISDKQPRTDDKSDQQESLAESYKIKQEVSDGDVEMAQAYLSDPLRVARAIVPHISPELVQKCEIAVTQLMMEPLNQHHLTLTQWVLAPAISMNYIPLVTKPALIKAMAATQAVLWHWQMYDLAALLGGVEIVSQDDEYVSVQEARSDKLSKEIVEELEKIFQNGYPDKGKNITVRQTNPGYVAVDTFHRLLAGKDWMLMVPAELLPHTGRVHGSRKMYVPVDLRLQVAKLLIMLYHNRLEFAERSAARMAGVDYPGAAHH